MKSARMLAILVLVLGLVGNVWAENGPVKFRATVTADEQHDVIPICYGDYFVQVSVNEVLEDAGAVLTGVTTVEVCYKQAHGFTVSNEVEVYGYYWGGTCPKQYCGRVEVSGESYYIGLASPIEAMSVFTYQGRLMEADSQADGQYDFLFRLYDNLGLGVGIQVADPCYLDDVEVIDGYFTVRLNFGSGVFNGQPRWLEIGVRPGASAGDLDDPGTYTILEPRQQITPTPYAIYAETGAGDGDNDWAVSPLGEMFSIPSGNVGIGTSSPMEKLHVVGNVRIEGASPAWLNLVGGFGEDTGISYTTTGVGVNKWEILRQGSSSNLLIRESFPRPPFSGSPVVLEAGTGNVGIGTTEPTALLHVQKDGTGSQLAAYFNNPTDGVDSEVEIQFGLGKMLPSAWSLKASSGLFNIANVAAFPPALSIRSTGRVGIGTTEPVAQLDVRRRGEGRQLAAYFSNPRDSEDSEVEVQFGLGTMLPSAWSLRAASGLFSICNVAVLPPALNITSTGYVGIGTATPETNLHLYKGPGGGSNPILSVDPFVVESDNNAYINVITPNNKWGGILFSDEGRDRGAIRYSHSADKMDFRTASTTRVAIDSSGNVGIGTTTPMAGYKLHVVGKIRCQSLTEYSSKDYKKDIQAMAPSDYSDILEKLSRTDVFRFRYKTDEQDGKLRIGLIAEQAPREVISEEQKGIDLGKAIGFLMAVAKAQQQKIAVLEEVAAENELLRQRLQALEELIQSNQLALSKEVQ